ncbi:MAG: hypothetical protein FWD66_00920 [Paludibacter sp.]|nr:hypothetical protein [Paludibacter sp.]
MKVTNKNKDEIRGDLENLSTILSRCTDNPNCHEIQEMVNHVIDYADSFNSIIWKLNK